MEINRLLDRLPRETFAVGAREVPAFRSFGVLGFHLALPVALLTGFRAGVTVLDTLAIAAAAGCSLFGWGLLRRAITGRETLVLLESVWAAFLAVAALRWSAGAPVLPGLDVLAVGVCAFLAVGRLGCLVSGCCHGVPAAVGVVYPPSAGLPARLGGVRLFPLPLVESAALMGIGTAGFALAGGPAGTAAAWVLAAYATVRFGTEALRGDHRPSIAGVTVARLMCVAQIAFAAWLSAWSGAAWPDAGRPGAAWTVRGSVVAGGVLAAAALAGALLAWRRRDPLAAPAHLDEIWLLIRALTPDGHVPVVAETSAGLRIAASRAGEGLHVSFSHAHRPVGGIPRALGLDPLATTGVAVHAVVSPTRLPDRVTGGRNGVTSGYHLPRASGPSRNGAAGGYFGDDPGA